MLDFIESKKLIESSDSIAIFTHANADGDAIGSAFALYYYLKDLGKKVDVFSDTLSLPSQLNFLNVENFLNKQNYASYDLAIVTDSNNLDMLGRKKHKFLKIKKSVQFDHHPFNPDFATINNVDICVSSASEVVARYFLENNIHISNKIGELLLSGIITDSGGFKFSCVTNKTMQTVAELLSKTEVKLHNIMHFLFESETMDSFLMQKEAYNTAEFLLDGKICVIKLDYNFYSKNSIDPNSCKFLTRIGTELKDVLLTAVISEVEPKVNKVSFRSREGYDASSCARVFGGGGHKQASGCKIFGEFSEVVKDVKKTMLDEINERNS